VSVVVATYEWPDALDTVLAGLADQSDPCFEVIVADDGSGPDTADLVDGWRGRFGQRRLMHVWQEDAGYRLARVRNLGATVAQGDLLVFIDGDMVPRQHFVRALRRTAVPGWFVGFKWVRLSRRLTERALARQLQIYRWPLPRWVLHRSDVGPLRALTARDRRRPGREGLPEFVPHADGYGLLGVFRTDFVRVNGYDSRFMGWGGEDVDMAVRLRRLGVRCGWPGPKSTTMHLWHESRKPRVRPNDPLLAETRASTRLEAIEGFRELEADLRAATAGAHGDVSLTT
jgi:glycosyltransferase involved in cell wall biosynthesis